MKSLLVLPLAGALLAGCVVAPSAPPMIARLPESAVPVAAPVSADGWRVVSVTPVAPGTPRDPNYTVETLPTAPAPVVTTSVVQQPVYYYPQPVVVERPVYVDPWPVAVGVGLTLGWWSSRWCCSRGYGHYGHYRGRH
ncbi:hypothetical protein [Massilia sp. TS11]|uniref:hypothetical protein n=1 Tax=Massilia sp. TS11 TaxID=2908003 RepID=UPI001EDA3708|nr:hypothetical protein [Massilia sp. TS11]MCG2586407.1 hypothetical protein [Massilia sp. TS11]